MPLAAVPLAPPLAATRGRAASAPLRPRLCVPSATTQLPRPGAAGGPLPPRGASLIAGARRAASAPAKPPADAPPSSREAPAVTVASQSGDLTALFGGWDALPGPEWDAVQRWVVFSDLHVSARTEAVCLEVLNKVLSTAREREAGVLFLGDFWHARGSLPVMPLNNILDLFSQWDVPTVMIPGNHDQVTAGGEQHALTPLGAAARMVHIFSRPAVWRGALWLPYRRDEAVLRAAMDAARAQHGALRAVFAHADVLGASLNEAHQARHGLEPAMFPPRTPVFTGHYHTPHTVPGTAITYVGAPYQVSLSEAGQAKRLMLLDADWRQLQEIALDLGPRYFALSGAAAAPPAGLRAGDRVRWTLEAAAAGSAPSPAPAAAAALEAAGVVVELVRPPEAPPPRIAAAEALGPAALLDAYADAVGLRTEARALAAHILAGLSGGAGGPAHAPAALELHAVELEGYGPFRECVRYPLHARGLVVVSGRNADDAAVADSNGAGKTTLCMAPLWALTGDADFTGSGGGGGRLTAAQVVADGSKEARVRLEGYLNGDPFWLERAATKRGIKHLRWGIGDVECTLADAPLTQRALDETLNMALLAKMAFHGQHSIEKLLDANDAEFKKELSGVVSLRLWEEAREVSAVQLKAAQKARESHDGSAKTLAALLADTRAAAGRAEAEAATWEAARAQRAVVAAAAVEAAHATARADAVPLRDALAALRRAYADASAAATAAKSAAREAADAAAAAEAADAAALAAAPGGPEDEAARAAFAAADVAEAQAGAAESEAQSARDAVAAADFALRAARTAVASFRGVVVAPGGAKGSVEGPSGGTFLGSCDRCAQPIDAAHFAGHVAGLETKAEAAAAVATAASAAAAKAQSDAQVLRAAAAAATRDAMRAEAAAGAAAEAARGAAAARRSAAETAAARAAAEAARLEGSVRAALATGKAARDAEEALAKALGEACELPAEAATAAPGAAAVAPAVAAAALDAAAAAAAAAEPAARASAAAIERAEAAAAAVAAERGEALSACAQLRAAQADQAARLAAAEAARDAEEARAGVLDEVDRAFNKGGIQSYLFDGVLADLEARAGERLRELTAGALTLTLRSAPLAAAAAAAEKRKRGTKGAKSKAAAAEDKLGPSKEAVAKRVWARAADGAPLERGLRQLSGGERRRVALALSLAFADLAAQRGGVRCSLLVLDEALQHLDGEGVARAAAMLRAAPHASTVLLTSQAAGRALAHADRVDYVVKEQAASRVEHAD